jgi:hypothetical protein
MVGLGDIVVLGGQPEQGNDRAAQGVLQAGGQADGSQRLVKSEQRAAEEARLLSRKHGEALRGAQLFDALPDDLRRVPGILLGEERIAQGLARIGEGVAAFRLSLIRIGIMGIMSVEWREARERMDVIPR